MDVLTMSSPLRRGEWIGIAGVVLAATLIAAPRINAGGASDAASDDAVKAAFLFNFAKFAEWPALSADAPIVNCIVGGDGVAAALVEMLRGQSISGRPSPVRTIAGAPRDRRCGPR